jgi:integrase
MADREQNRTQPTNRTPILMFANNADTRVSGHVILRQGSRGPIYYLKHRLPDGRQVKRRLGKAWTERGRAPVGYYTNRTAEEALQAILTDARRGTLAGMTNLNTKFADASAEWLRYVQHDRDGKPSTLSDYRHMAKRLDRTFGEIPIERIDPVDIEHWRAGLSCSNRTSQKYLIVLNGIFKRAMKVYRTTPWPWSSVPA